MTTRGIRNNNPGNIDRSPANKWQGRMRREDMTPAQKAEKRFEVFASPAWGIRAMCVLIITYFDRHGCNTVRKIITRWAPPSENDTDAYVRAVARNVGVEPDDWINVHEYARLRPLIVSIITHENGHQPYPPEVIEEGLRLAGVVKPGDALVARPEAATKATVAALATGGTAAVVEGVNHLLPALQSMGQVAAATGAMPSALRAAMYVLVAVSVGASLYAWWRLRCASEAVSA